MPKKPHSASFRGRSRPGPGRGAVDGGRGRQHLGREASPGPRGPQCPPSSPFPGASRVGPAHQSQPRFGPARPRPLPTAQGRPARPPQPELQEPPPRAGAGHSEQLRRGDCTARPAGPAPTGARRPQQPQHRDLGPRAGYGCALRLSAQVGAPGAPRRDRGTGLRERARGSGWQGLGEAPWRVSLGRFSSAQGGQPRAARGGDASRPGSRALPPELGRW